MAPRKKCIVCDAESFPMYYLDTRTSSKWKSTDYRYCVEGDHILKESHGLEVVKA